jgi:molybdopterin/thiamine biosynthesis adenylyltransferase
LREAAAEQFCPDGSKRKTISHAVLEKLREGCNLPLRELELQALEENIIPLRYLRNMGTLEVEGQLRLLRSRVAIFGLGGLGGAVVELLARMGVGSLVVVDGDTFSDDNLNRQILSIPSKLGMEKVAVAKERIVEINPAAEVSSLYLQATYQEMLQIIEGCDVVVDALDNIPSRLDLQRACASREIPLVHGAIAGFVGQVMTIYPGDPGLELLYQGDSEKGIEVTTGNPATTPMLVASLQVAEVVKILCGIGEPLRQRLLLIDTENNIFEVIEME